MALYEHMFLARQDIAPQQVDELLNLYKGVIETHGGKVGRVENWGLRPLAYRIRKTVRLIMSWSILMHQLQQLLRWNVRCESMKIFCAI